jgi:hypothetical protein
MVRPVRRREDRSHTRTEALDPMHTLRASAIALPFVGLAAMVWAISMLIGPVR